LATSEALAVLASSISKREKSPKYFIVL